SGLSSPIGPCRPLSSAPPTGETDRMVDSIDGPGMITAQELAVAVGVAPATVEGWHAAGLLLGGRNRHPLADIERARLILSAERRGITAEDVAAACATQG